MTANVQGRQLMFQQFNNVAKVQNTWSSDTADRKVTFNDLSESGYSTTASSDDGTVSPQKNLLQRTKKMTSDKLLRQQAASSNRQAMKKGRRVAAEQVKLQYRTGAGESFQLYQSEDFIDPYYSNLKSVSMTPSPTSPMPGFANDANSYYYPHGGCDSHGLSYYDPLHLAPDSQSTCNFVDNDKWVNHTQVDTDGSDSSYSTKRGILKKTNLASSNPHLASDSERLERPNKLLPFNYSSPVKFHSDSAQASPIRVPAVYAINKTPSPLISSDGSRKSAFTPVAPRKSRVQSSSDQSDTSSNFFTPVKGPAVADYVASNERMSDIDQLGSDDALFEAPEPHHYHTLKPKATKLKGHNQISSRSMQDLRSLGHSHDHDHHGHHHHHRHLQQPFLQQPIPAPRSQVPKAIRDLANLQINDNYDTESIATSESNTSSVSPVPKVESLINDAVRLDQYLDNCSAKELKRLLKEKLQSKDPKCIKALSTLIPSNVAKQVKSHCVRCHKKFNPNERSRCYLPHPESMVFKVGQDAEGADFHCQCCSTGFRLLKMDFYEESTNSLLTGHCYSGHHTADPESVDYREIGGAAKSCEENGCVTFYV